MSESRREYVNRAVQGELKPCARCGRPRWFHLLRLSARRAEDWRDDGHVFDTGRPMAAQLKLIFKQPA